MKVATAGIGLRAGHVLSVLKQTMPEIEFVGFHDPQPTHLAMIGEDVRQFDSVAEMLAISKPDLYFVGSPNRFHLDQIRAGLEADVPHIFAEKPVVVSIPETMALARLLRQHGGASRVMVGLVLRYSQHMVDLRAAMLRARHIYVVGRDTGFGAAQELALKIKETCAIHSEAYSTAEVLHGPLQLAINPLMVLVLDTGAPGTSESIDTGVARFRAAGSEVHMVASAVPGLTPAAAAAAILRQIYPVILDVARALGHDPDAPAALSNRRPFQR